MAEHWYNSNIANYVGLALLFVGLGTGMNSCMKGCEAMYSNRRSGDFELKMEALRRGVNPDSLNNPQYNLD